MIDWTPTESRILAVLADGRPHSRAEILACLDDELAMPTAIFFHISNIRKKLAPFGQTVLCLTSTRAQPVSYRHVQILTQPNPVFPVPAK